jgi:hypothetical protein
MLAIPQTLSPRQRHGSWRGLLAVTIAAVAALLASPAAAGATSVVSEGFEGGLNGWMATGFWHVQESPQDVEVSPEITPSLVTLAGTSLPAAFAGNSVAWFGEASTGTFCGEDALAITQTAKNGCSSVNEHEGTLTSPTFSLVGALSAILRFRAWWEIEGVNADDFDLMSVEYSTDGGTGWTSAGKLNPSNNPASEHWEGYSNNGLRAEPGWKEYLVDLSPAIDSAAVKVRFSFDTVDEAYNGFRGLLVDSVNVSTPFDADGPLVAKVSTCNGLQPAPIWTATGANFVQGSKVYLDGALVPNAAIPASDRIELQQGLAGSHTLRVVSPNGDSSNLFQFAAGNCSGAGPGPSGADKRPTVTQVFCNYIVLSETDTCTATVADATGGGTIPTGKVKFTSSSGGAFLSGDSCTLQKHSLSTVSNCTIQNFKPAKGKPLGINAEYEGNDKLAPSAASTQFFLAAPGTSAYAGTIQPAPSFGSPDYSNPSVSVEVKNPVGGSDLEVEGSVTTSGDYCNVGFGLDGGASAASLAVPSEVVSAAVVAAAKKQSGKGKGKGKGRKRKLRKIPWLKQKKVKQRKVKAVLAKRGKRNAKAGKHKLKLKFNKRKLRKLFGKRKRVRLVVRVTVDIPKGKPAVIYKSVTLKKVKGKKKGKRGGAKRRAKAKPAAGFVVESLSTPVGESIGARAAATRGTARSAQQHPVFRWDGQNGCSRMFVGAQKIGAGPEANVKFGWAGTMVCLSGATVPFNVTPPIAQSRLENASLAFSFYGQGSTPFQVDGTLFGSTGVANGGVTSASGADQCRADAPATLTRTQ